MPARAVPDRDGYFELWSRLHGGYDPRVRVGPRTWLSIVYLVAAPLARRRVSPDALTLLGLGASAVAVALTALGGRWPLLAAVVVVGSGLLDSVDGAVAVLTGRSTAFGYVLDSIVDRLSDMLYLLALWFLGALAWLCVLGGLGTLLQEYLRARAGNAGMAKLGVVTVAERPTRVIVTALALIAAGAWVPYADAAGTVGAAAWLATAVVGLVQLLVVVRRQLSDS